MDPGVEIRPLRDDDVAAADRVGFAALRWAIAEDTLPADEEERARRGRARIVHVQARDPDGAWVAERAGEVVGVALAIVREGLWGLSLLAVAPAQQGRGVGGRLLAAALSTARDVPTGLILSSTDPRAMRRYHRGGFALRPCVSLAGPVNALRIPPGLRSRAGDPDADRAVIDRASRHVRGASHAVDVPAMLDAGGTLLVLQDRGFAVHRRGSPLVLAACDDAAATDLLWSCLAAAGRGATVHLDSVTAGNDWAIRAGLDAGLALAPDGPVFVSGDPGPLVPYLPSGAYL